MVDEVSLDRLTFMTQAHLNELFGPRPGGPIPTGQARAGEQDSAGRAAGHLGEGVNRAQLGRRPGECAVLEHSHSSLLAHRIHDEIRQVALGLFLGVVFWERRKILNFMLEFER